MSCPYQDTIETLKECLNLGEIERVLNASDGAIPEKRKRERLLSLGCRLVRKRCSVCGLMKPIGRFASHAKAKDGKYKMCDECLSESMTWDRERSGRTDADSDS